jgi:hypothetical protein
MAAICKERRELAEWVEKLIVILSMLVLCLNIFSQLFGIGLGHIKTKICILLLRRS